MKRFVYLVVTVAIMALWAGAVTAHGGTRPDDRATHGPGAVATNGLVTLIRPDDRANHGPGAVTADGILTSIRPDDRANHGPGGLTIVQTPTPPTVTVDRFDWADAGIGAGAAFGLGLLLLGASALVLRRERVEALS